MQIVILLQVMMEQILQLRLMMKLLLVLFNHHTVLRPTTRGLDGTTVATHTNSSTVELYQINGIPLDQINKTHTAIKMY